MAVNNIKILIVDDEPLAQDILESYIGKLAGFELVAKCNNALEAFGIISKSHVDIMFLDIDMPEINGLDFFKSLKNPPNVIFTTAHSNYAVESYDLNAVDYLLKPISFERFMKSINKTLALINNTYKEADNTAVQVKSDNTGQIIFVKSDSRHVKINLAQLSIIEGFKDYVKLWINNDKIIVHSTMKNFEDQLAQYPYFLRVHKSYIVNVNHITEIDGNVIRIAGQMVAIGNTYKEDVHKFLNGYKIT